MIPNTKLGRALEDFFYRIQRSFYTNVDWDMMAEELRKGVLQEEEEKKQQLFQAALQRNNLMNSQSNQMAGIQNQYAGQYSNQIRGHSPSADPNALVRQLMTHAETEDDPTMATKQSNPTILSPVGTLSFANTLFEKRAATEGAEEVYSCNVIFDPDDQKTDAYKAMKKAIKEAADKFFGEGKYPRNMRWPIRDAAEKEGQYEGYKSGDTFITVKTKSAPGVIGPKKEDVVASQVWSGQRARVALRPYAYNKAGNAGVGLALESVQIAKFDMPRMDGRAADPRKVFDDLDGDSAVSEDDEIPF